MSDQTPFDRTGFLGSLVGTLGLLLFVAFLASSCVQHVTGNLDPNPVYNFQRERNQNITTIASLFGLAGFGIALAFAVGFLKDEWRKHQDEIETERRKREAAAHRVRQAEIELAYRRQLEIDDAARARANIAELRKQIAEQEARVRDAESKLRSVR